MIHLKEVFGLCLHDWNIVSKDVGESPLEHLQKLGYKKEYYEPGCTNKKILIVLSCKKCGKLKHYTEII